MTATIVYKCPGPNLVTGGITFSTLGIDDSELPEAVQNGWFETLPQAIEAFTVPKVAKAPAPQPEPAKDEPDDNAPPTRDELIQQAEKIGLDVDGRWSDKRLLKEIEEAMAAQSPTAEG